MQGSFINANHLAQQARKNEMMRKMQERAKKRRQIELLVPRLEILRNLPFFIPFETRVQIFREFVHRDQRLRRNGFVDADSWRMSIVHGSQGRAPDGRPAFQDVLHRHHAEIRRTSIFEDAFDSYYKLGEELKEPIQISFIDKFGTVEAGIDGGGVTKEFLTSVTNEAFAPEASHRMFVENDQHSLYPDPTAFESTVESLKRLGFPEGTEDFNEHLRELLRRYEFLGRIIGKCLYEGILIDVSFAGFFLLKWALTGGTSLASNESAYRASINDLRDLDEELYQGLVSAYHVRTCQFRIVQYNRVPIGY
jgi:ubiquitin-protein ligase E3 C